LQTAISGYFTLLTLLYIFAFSALMLLFVGQQEGHLACKNGVVGSGMIICLQ